jgi:hypothetical protein
MAISIHKIVSIVKCPTYILQRKCMNVIEIEKLEQAIEVHGYRGVSSSKHNGVVNIKPDDIQLLKALDKFKNKDIEFIKEHSEKNKYLFHINVKIVAHVTNGDRAIGLLYKNTKDEFILYLLGFANYNYKLF